MANEPSIRVNEYVYHPGDVGYKQGLFEGQCIAGSLALVFCVFGTSLLLYSKKANTGNKEVNQ